MYNWEFFVSELAYAKWCQEHAGHVEYRCPQDCENPACMFCQGGLFACTRCGAFEGSTPSECPGIQMSAEQEDAVYAGIIDYRFGQWVAACTITMMHTFVGPPPAPSGFKWDWDYIMREVDNRPYEPRTIDA
jgi:hypothetical protein